MWQKPRARPVAWSVAVGAGRRGEARRGVRQGQVTYGARGTVIVCARRHQPPAAHCVQPSPLHTQAPAAHRCARPGSRRTRQSTRAARPPWRSTVRARGKRGEQGRVCRAQARAVWTRATGWCNPRHWRRRVTTHRQVAYKHGGGGLGRGVSLGVRLGLLGGLLGLGLGLALGRGGLLLRLVVLLLLLVVVGRVVLVVVVVAVAVAGGLLGGGRGLLGRGLVVLVVAVRLVVVIVTVLVGRVGGLLLQRLRWGVAAHMTQGFTRQGGGVAGWWAPGGFRTSRRRGRSAPGNILGAPTHLGCAVGAVGSRLRRLLLLGGVVGRGRVALMGGGWAGGGRGSSARARTHTRFARQGPSRSQRWVAVAWPTKAIRELGRVLALRSCNKPQPAGDTTRCTAQDRRRRRQPAAAAAARTSESEPPSLLLAP